MAPKSKQKAKSGKGAKPGTNGHKRTEKSIVRDRHILYEASVQSPGEDVRFFTRLFKRRRKRPLRRLREDFCGTAVLACEFVKAHPENRAWGVDFHQPTLDWGIEHHVSKLGADAERLELLCADVMDADTPLVDAVGALNFSYWIFKERETMLRYFRRARAALVDDGVFFLDVFGGQDAMASQEEDRKISGQRGPDGQKIPTFKYTWHQAKFNVVNHDMTCHIHFKLGDGTKLRKAFSYHWRVWTLPELQDLLIEAGFTSTEVHMEGWDDDNDEADGIFRRRSFMENQLGWVGYLVALV